MRKILPLIIISLLLLTPIQINAKTLAERFPLVKEGNYFVYEVAKNGTSSGIKISQMRVITYDWRYDIIDVNEKSGIVIINVTWKRYENGVLSETGGYTARVNASNLLYFKVFFDVTRLKVAVREMLEMFNLGNKSTISITNITYNWQGIEYQCLNASYDVIDGNERLAGYFIISVKYGIMFERVQYRIQNITTGIRTKTLVIPSVIMRLTKTNAFLRVVFFSYILPAIIIIAVIVAIIIIRRRSAL